MSMNLRGKWADRCTGAQDALLINVTSAQSKESKNRRDFSPMTPSGYCGFYNFEAFWQSGKVFMDVPRSESVHFWKTIKHPKRRFPNSKGKKVLYSQWDLVTDDCHDSNESKRFDYVSSRKQVYVPRYHKYMCDSEMAKYWKAQVDSGKDVVICDFDGPRLEDGTPTCCELTLDLLIEKINSETFPFGHGFVVGAFLAGISIESFIA